MSLVQYLKFPKDVLHSVSYYFCFNYYNLGIGPRNAGEDTESQKYKNTNFAKNRMNRPRGLILDSMGVFFKYIHLIQLCREKR